MENWCEERDTKKGNLNLIMYVDNELAPKKLLTGVLYRRNTSREVKDLGVVVIFPAKIVGRKKGEERIALSDFEASKKKNLLFYPQSYTSNSVKTKKTRLTEIFDFWQHGVYSLQTNYPGKRGRKNSYLHHAGKKIHRTCFPILLDFYPYVYTYHTQINAP